MQERPVDRRTVQAPDAVTFNASRNACVGGLIIVIVLVAGISLLYWLCLLQVFCCGKVKLHDPYEFIMMYDDVAMIEN